MQKSVGRGNGDNGCVCGAEPGQEEAQTADPDLSGQEGLARSGRKLGKPGPLRSLCSVDCP